MVADGIKADRARFSLVRWKAIPCVYFTDCVILSFYWGSRCSLSSSLSFALSLRYFVTASVQLSVHFCCWCSLRRDIIDWNSGQICLNFYSLTENRFLCIKCKDSLPRRRSEGLVTRSCPTSVCWLERKKRRQITADFQILEVHFGPWEIARLTL